MVTYHPAYLLRFGGERQTALKREAWHDLQMLEKAYARYR
jgi:uracil-DNA glycosylase